MSDFDNLLDDINEYAEGEILAERRERSGREYCPDCEAEITDGNELIPDIYNPEAHGSCLDCYDPTPAGQEYSPGFEMNH